MDVGKMAGKEFKYTGSLCVSVRSVVLGTSLHTNYSIIKTQIPYSFFLRKIEDSVRVRTSEYVLFMARRRALRTI